MIGQSEQWSHSVSSCENGFHKIIVDHTISFKVENEGMNLYSCLAGVLVN